MLTNDAVDNITMESTNNGYNEKLVPDYTTTTTEISSSAGTRPYLSRRTTMER